MDRKGLRLMWGCFIGVLLLCILTLWLMAISIDKDNQKLVKDVGQIYMDEMSTQLQNHFNSIIELRLDMVEGIIVRNPPESFPRYSDEMIEQLKMNGKTRNFDFLALYTRDGTMEVIYGEPVSIKGEEAFLESLNSDDSKIARAMDSSGDELLMLGVSTIYPMEEGKTCTALVAGINLDYINYAMQLGGDKSLCYAHIINKDGDFVIRSDNTEYIAVDNYFDYLLQCEGDVPMEQMVAEMKEKMADRGEYTSSVLVNNGAERRQIYCVPLPHSEWYLVSVMPHGRLDEVVQSRSHYRTMVSGVACLIIILLMLVVFLIYYRMSTRQIKLLTEARLEADHANQAKSRFLSNMSHDIRTPMNAVIGMTTIALANKDDPEQVETCLNKVMIAGRHLLGLINDILDMSKIESGKMALNREVISIRKVLDELVLIIQSQIKEKDQNFDIYIGDFQTEEVYCDSVRLNQVLLNLLSNALKFTPEGGRITMTVSQEDSPKGEKYVRTNFWVKDTGVGMSDEFQKQVFDSFAREDDMRIQKIEGTGLGMAITKHIIDMAGGTIEVKSEVNKGSEFHVILDEERAEAQNEEMLLPNWDVLVVDDDELLCHSAVGSLNEIGVNTEWALDGATAIDMAEKRHAQSRDYHVILLDWKMPGMDGIETARELQARVGEDVSVLLISAYDWGDIESEARAAGIKGFLTKPLFKSTLYYGLRRFADSVEADQEALEPTVGDFAGRRLLIAEDSEVNWEIARELLADKGFISEWAENGQICVEMFDNAQPGYYDAILMDLRMPVMSGIDATIAVRALEREDAKTIPIIAMTADAFDEDVKKCIDSGMNAHVAKPLDMNKLLRLLQKFIR